MHTSMNTSTYGRTLAPASLQHRSPQVGGPNFVLGPGGQASIVSAQDDPPVAAGVVSPSPSQNPSQNGDPTSPPLASTTQSVVANTQSQPQAAIQSMSPTFSTLASQSTAGAAPDTIVMSSSTSSVITSTLDSLSASETQSSAVAMTSELLSTSTVSLTLAAIPSSSSAVSSNADTSNHTPPFYVGIVLGTIVIIACVAALAAWCVRLRKHARRRRDFVPGGVPWGNQNDDGLEEGRDTVFVGNTTASLGGMRDNHSSDWGLTGDRDVGEPKRTESFLQQPVLPVKKPLSDPFAEPRYPSRAISSQDPGPYLADSVAFPLPLVNGPYPTTRPLPTHLASADFSIMEDRAHTLGPLQVANMTPGDMASMPSRPGTVLGMGFGTPRESVPGSRPRFWSVDGGGLKVPWATLPSDLVGGRGRGKWEPLQERTEKADGESGFDTEGWTASLKSNLLNAFNAVASNLPSGPTLDQDKLTPIPPRRATRRSIHEPPWEMYVGGDLVGNPLTREGTMQSMGSCTSRAWTLEETGNGVGVVHIRGLGLENYGGGDHAWSPRPSQASLSLMSDHGADCRTIGSNRTYASHTPLIIAKKPAAALIKPSKDYRDALSRASSVYSTSSAGSSVIGNGAPRLPRIHPMSRNGTIRSRGRGRSSDSVSYQSQNGRRASTRPGRMDRMMSSSSVGASVISSKEVAAKRALQSRMEKVMLSRKEVFDK